MIGDKKGFTIAELLVAMGIFGVMVTIISSVYVTSISSQRRAYGKQNVLDSSRYALETMARAIRQNTATEIEIDDEGDYMVLDHPEKGGIVYRLAGTRITEQDTGPLFGSAQNLTADDVVVETLIFRGQGLEDDDGEQPRVTITMVVRSRSAKASEESRIRLQTTITPRIVQIP